MINLLLYKCWVLECYDEVACKEHNAKATKAQNRSTRTYLEKRC